MCVLDEVEALHAGFLPVLRPFTRHPWDDLAAAGHTTRPRTYVRRRTDRVPRVGSSLHHYPLSTTGPSPPAVGEQVRRYSAPRDASRNVPGGRHRGNRNTGEDRKMRRRTLVLAAIACVALAACGDDTSTLSDVESLDVATARAAFSQTVLDGGRYDETLEGVDRIVELCREDPDAIYEMSDGSLTMRAVVEDAASTLAEYQPELAAELDRALAGSCR